jgi:Domain of unknown function (DUF397)
MNNAMPTFERSEFRKSTRSGQNPQACVEVARGGGWVAIRDSKQAWDSADDHRLVFTADQFDAWLAALSSGSAETGCIDITQRADGVNVLASTVPQTHDNELTFDDAEIAAFLDGARDGEFATAARM